MAEKYKNFYDACINNQIQIAMKIYDTLHFVDNNDFNMYDMFIHCCKNKSYDVIKWLYSVKNRFGMFILPKVDYNFEIACLIGDTVSTEKYFNNDIKHLPSVMFSTVCRAGHYDTAKYLHSIGINNIDYGNIFIKMCDIGNTDLAKWLYSLSADANVQMDVYTAFNIACENGHIHIAKWLYNLKSNDEPNNKLIYDAFFNVLCKKDACSVNVLKWLYKLDCKVVVNNLYRINGEDNDIISKMNKLGIDSNLFSDLCDIRDDKLLSVVNNEIGYSDIFIYTLIHYNRIYALARLNFPHVSYEIVDGIIVNPKISRCRTKNARNMRATLL